MLAAPKPKPQFNFGGQHSNFGTTINAAGGGNIFGNVGQLNRGPVANFASQFAGKRSADPQFNRGGNFLNTGTTFNQAGPAVFGSVASSTPEMC